MSSIQNKLLFWLILCISLSTLCSGLLSYNNSLNSTTKLFDYLLEEVASALPAHFDTKAVYPQEVLNKHIVVQIWNQQNQLLYNSNPEWALQLDRQQGFKTIQALGVSWRIYTINRQNNFIQVAYETEGVNGLATDLALNVVLPFIFFIPLMLVLVIFIIHQSLKPFRSTAQALTQRTPEQLDPLPTQHLSKELYIITQAINELFAHLRKALHAQRAFVADAAHELRSPLTALKLQLQLAERTPQEPQHSQALNKLHERLNRAIHLVEQMLLLARQEASLDANAKTLSSINELVLQVIQSQQSFAQQQKVKIVKQLSADNPILLVNPSSIETLIRNLLENAIKYSPEQGLVRVEVLNETVAVALVITDTGCGIDPSERDLVFNRFYRASDNWRSGTGLGLAIVKSIAEQHQASITLHNNPTGTGLQVRVSFLKQINKN